MNSTQNRTMSNSPVYRLLSSVPIWELTYERGGLFPQVLVEVIINGTFAYLLGYYTEEALATDRKLQSINTQRVRIYNRPAEGRVEAATPLGEVLYIANAETDTTEYPY